MIGHNRFEEHLFVLSEKLAERSFSPAFPERLQTALLSSTLSNTSGHRNSTVLRSVSAPIFGTDLGVRVDTDPSEFYLTHCKLASVEPLNSAVVRDILLDSEISSIGMWIDAILLFLGDYASVSLAVNRRVEELLADADYSTLITAGVASASLDPKVALRLFQAASEKTSNASDAYGALHRRSATLAKRLRDNEQALECLQRAYDEFIFPTDTGDAEFAMNSALYHNLRALIVLNSSNQGGLLGATSELEQAKGCLQNALSQPGANISRAGRYASQVAINEAQLAVQQNDANRALTTLENNTEFCRQNVPDYVGEAAAEQSYVCFLCGDYDQAIALSSEAAVHFYYLGSIRGIETSRKILSASLWESGLSAVATKISDDITSDRLGLRTLDYLNSTH